MCKPKKPPLPIIWLFITWSLLLLVSGQCPWSRELVDLHTDCVCAYSNTQRLSIQCSPVNFTKLVLTLRTSVKNIPIDLLYINNSTIEILQNSSFEDLNIQSLHLSKSKIRDIEDEAFKGLESSLTSLNLQDNLLREVPVAAMKDITSLQLLDLSHNFIQEVTPDAFMGLPLTTLKLSDNHLNMSELAFHGLEGSLKNLNLQACDLKEMPRAIQRLKLLAFLDLAQNKIEQLEPSFLSEMQSLTAINLERNKIRVIDEKAFIGVNSTLSSLSLLNNQLTEYPLEAVAMLTEIRVLDLGFNKIENLPHDAFKRNKYLTLLALDGNPLSTIPMEAFLHLNSTLRGLSIGGSALECDCKIRWISEWVQEKDLQVTSRERNPQFCGHPEHLRRRSFFQLLPTDLTCMDENEASTIPYRLGTKRPKRLESDFDIIRANDVKSNGEKGLQIVTVDAAVEIAGTTRGSRTDLEPSEPAVRSGTVSRKKEDQIHTIRFKHAFKRDSTLVLEWEPTREPVLGYQVLIRMFGSRDFKRIIPIQADQRRIQVENLPLSQCIVVCVVDYEDPSVIKIENIPAKQCRELKGDDNKIISLDKIVIAASAIICVIVIIGALIVILFYLRRRDAPTLHSSTTTIAPGVIPIMKPPPETDWETLSWNSGRSTPKTPHCMVKSGSTSHSFVLSDGAPMHKPRLLSSNGFSKSYSTQDNESRLSYSHISKANSTQNNLDIQRSKSLTRPSGYHPYTGGYIKKNKKQQHRNNGRLASASSSTECESDWNGRSIWKDNDVDIYISQNHMVPGSKKYRKDYSIR